MAGRICTCQWVGGRGGGGKNEATTRNTQPTQLVASPQLYLLLLIMPKQHERAGVTHALPENRSSRPLAGGGTMCPKNYAEFQ